MTPHEKIDDEDGHYIVVEDTPIGDRCRFKMRIILSEFATLTSPRSSQSTARSRHVWQGGRSL